MRHGGKIDSVRAFARKLEESGNEDVDFFVSEGMPHGFYFFPRIFRQEVESYEAIEKFLKRHL